MKTSTIILTPLMLAFMLGSANRGTALNPLETISPNTDTLSPGESLSYTIQYYGIPGGTADIKIDSGPSHLNDTLVFRADVKTNFAISAFWRIEDTFMTLVEKNGFRTLMTRLWEDENGKKQYREEKYRHNKIKIQETIKNKTKTFSVKTSGNAVDGLSALWLLRSKPLELGDVESFNLFANRKVFNVQAEVLSLEGIKINNQNLETIKVHPVLHTANGKKVRNTDVTIWYTNDQKRRPVQIKVKNAYGNLKFLLNN